jgi:hypothetical protein
LKIVDTTCQGILTKFYIKYDAQKKAYLSDDQNIKEVEQKERTETIVYYQEVIR